MTLVAAASRISTGESAEDARARTLSLGVARGNRESVAAFYEAWFNWTLAAARRASGRDESFALDIVQDVMIRVAGRMPPLASHAQLERWMWRVVSNASLDALRGERRRRSREQAHQPAAALEQRDAEQLAWLAAELRRLHADERLLLRARFGGAVTLRQLSLGIGHTKGALHGRIRTAVERMRKRAEGTNDE